MTSTYELVLIFGDDMSHRGVLYNYCLSFSVFKTWCSEGNADRLIGRPIFFMCIMVMQFSKTYPNSH